MTDASPCDHERFRAFLHDNAAHVAQWPAWKRDVTIYGFRREPHAPPILTPPETPQR